MVDDAGKSWDEAFEHFNRSAHRGNADGMFLGSETFR